MDKETCKALRIRLTYSWSDVKKFEALIDDWDLMIQADKDELQNVQYLLDVFDKPFGIFDQYIQAKDG
jgi:hypothetical protein